MSYRLFLPFLLLFSLKLQATHIVGGEITYKYTSDNIYQVKLRLYIDCYNGDPNAIAQDLFANFTVFEGDSGKLLPNLCTSVQRTTPVRVSKTNYNCIKISPNACVDAYDYDTDLYLPPRKGGYYISYQRCCRNQSILNLINPLSTGENIWTKVNDTTGVGYNSSPVFKNLPPNFLCTNAPLVFDHSATDEDGDSLVYEFFHPYTGGTTMNPRPECSQYKVPPFPQIIFQSAYVFSNAIPSSPQVNLNSSTGLLKMTPTLSGQFVVGIVVKEYRKGQLIGYTQRDYQFNVQECVFETTSAFVNPSVNCNREVFFTNNSQNADSYSWDFGDSTTNADTADTKDAYYRYPTAGTFRVRLTAAKGNCLDSIVKMVSVFDRINFRLPPDTIICDGSTIRLKPDSTYPGATYLWNTGSTDSFIQVQLPGQYRLDVKLGNCSSSDTCEITLDDLRVKILSDSLVCNPGNFQLESVLRVKGDYWSLLWLSPDVQIPNGYSDSLLFINKSGHYFINGVNAHNCQFSDSVWVNGVDIRQYIKVPNVFSPNGDGFNQFFPDLQAPYSYKIAVFDRWGVKVYEKEDQPWDGGGLPSGTYYFFMEMKGCEYMGKTHGVVELVR